jgi:hypothetical protein
MYCGLHFQFRRSLAISLSRYVGTCYSHVEMISAVRWNTFLSTDHGSFI